MGQRGKIISSPECGYRALAQAILLTYEHDKKTFTGRIVKNKIRLCEKVFSPNDGLPVSVIRGKLYQAYQLYERQLEEYVAEITFEQTPLYELCTLLCPEQIIGDDNE